MSEICSKRIHGNYRSHQCGNTAKFEVDGRHYCGIHNPNKAKTKAQIEADFRYEARDRILKIERAAPDLLEACKVALNIIGFGKEHDQLSAAIAKATGATT